MQPGRPGGGAIPWVRWPIHATVLILTLIWIMRTYAAGRRFQQEASGRPALVQVGRAAAGALAARARRGFVRVRFAPDAPARAAVGAGEWPVLAERRQPASAIPVTV